MRRALPLLICVFIVASVCIFLFGDSGVVALRSLERYERSLSANVEALKQRNAELTARLEQFRNDPEKNRVLARGVDMYGAGDVVIKLQGSPSRPVTYAMGDLVRMKRAEGGSSALVKAMAMAVTFLLGGLVLFNARNARRKTNGGHGR